MEILVKNITPSVSLPSGISCRITMIKAAGGVPLFNNMKLIKDLGLQFATIVSKYRDHYGIFECPLCGTAFRTTFSNSRRIKSCGCIITGDHKTHGMSQTRIYFVWNQMRNRCKNHKDYKGRGIFVCAEWVNSFQKFYKWAINNGYREGLDIDREDNDKGYSPENCRWTTECINAQNTRLLSSVNTTGYRGVFFNKYNEHLNKRWYARIEENKKRHHLGYFLTPEQAAQAYNNFIIAHGTAHPLNIIK